MMDDGGGGDDDDDEYHCYWIFLYSQEQRQEGCAIGGLCSKCGWFDFFAITFCY